MKAYRAFWRILLLATLVCNVPWIHAQVPHVIRYNSGISLSGTNYEGTGFFKFALVNPEGNVTFWSNDGSSVSGSEPFKALPILVAQGTYEVDLGDTNLANMQPISPAIFTNANIQVRVWFSQQGQVFTPVAPDQPIASVAYAMMAANVPDGAITAGKIAEGAVTSSKLAPHAISAVNIAAGSIGSDQLAPNAVANSLQASGSLLLSDQPYATNLINAGFRRIGTVNSEKDQWEVFAPYGPLPRAGHAAVWTGSEMYVWGGIGRITSTSVPLGDRYNPATDTWNPVQTNQTTSSIINMLNYGGGQAIWTGSEIIILLNRVGTPGYIYNPATDKMRPISKTNAFFSSYPHPYVWTGNEVLSWGGSSGSYRYNPKTDTWKKISISNAPLASTINYSAVWTGSEMIIWGGSMTAAKAGGRYNPETDTWKSIKATTNSMARSQHNAVWTGRYMIVWGGRVGGSINSSSTGEIYDPATDTWKAISSAKAPTGRMNYEALWTGTEMLVWGGYSVTNNRTTMLVDGGRYNPATDTWTAMTQAPVQPLASYSVVWTGTEMLLWGGTPADPRRVNAYDEGYVDTTKPFSNAGWRYSPASNTWKPMAFTPVGRIGHTAIWTGHELIIWGGSSAVYNPGYLQLDGARFQPSTGRWYPISSFNAPMPRTNHQAVWTGTEMVIWGGVGFKTNVALESSMSVLNTGGRYNPLTDAWRPTDTNAAPSPRVAFSMVWAQDDMIVFGGHTNIFSSPANAVANGGLYNPVADSWTSLSTLARPSPRHSHSAVWTGREMLVWGGSSNAIITTNPTQVLNTGALYSLLFNLWAPISTNGSPSSRQNHIAIWTGQEMVIWGGEGVNPKSGGVYNPVSDTWKPISTIDAPSSARGQQGVWTGSELIVWGGVTPAKYAGRYNPKADTWTLISSVKAPKARIGFQAIWAGNEMLVFGGSESASSTTGLLPNSLLRYRLNSPIYLYGK